MKSTNHNTTTPKTPSLRFPGFSGEWVTVKLGKLLEIRSASRVHKEQWTKEGIPFFRSSDVVAEYKGLDNSKAFISKELFSELSKKSGQVKKNDLLVTGGGSIGLPYLVKTNNPLYFKDADLLWLKNTGRLDNQFLYLFYSTRTFRRYLKSITHVGTIAHYTIEQAKETPINVPGPEEQQRIAAFMSVVDQLISNLREQKQALLDYKRGLMQKIFSQQIRFKAEDGRDYLEWEEKKLSILFEERVERNGEEELNLLSVSIKDGITKQDVSLKRDSSSSDKSKYKVIFVGDIAYNTMRMWQGASGVSNLEGIVSPAYTVVKLKRGNVDFFGYLFKYPRTIFDFYRYSQGLTSDTWNLKFRHFSEVQVTTPVSISEQQKIASFLTSIDGLIESKQDQISQATNWKKGLMQRMFV